MLKIIETGKQMSIHKQAVQIIGKTERLNHLRKEAIELAHEIDRYLDGKSNAERVVGEAHDVAYLAKSLAHIEGFEDFCGPSYQNYLESRSEARLKDALNNAEKAPEIDDIGEDESSINVADTGEEMPLSELFEHERYLAGISSAYLPDGVFQLLDRIEAAVIKRIEALEAQVPKVVKPALERHVSGAYYLCLCGTAFDGINRFKFCPYCGAKLNWEENK